MNIIQLQYLIDVGRLGSFTDAAKKNRMTVPTISQSIAQLEAELDVELFSRSRKGTIPTIEGNVVIQHAVSVLKNIERMKNDISLLKSENKGNLVIATIPGIISKMINTTIGFRKEFPHVNIQLVEGDSAVVLSQVKNGDADFGFLSFSSKLEEESLNWEPLIKGETVLIVNKQSDLRFKENISGEDLSDEMIVLYNDPYLIKITQNILSEKSRNEISLTTNNVEAIFQMIINGNAVTIWPNYLVNFFPQHIKDQIVTIRLKKYKTIPYYLWRVIRKEEKVTPIIEKFTAQLFID
ncbi:LysR family transcriptional regulator [Gottfriedia luciferensis]|uniref:LysR family transcriptional regulator n=1 Tax=Gottfriedia luciferensis TaxID=178774 RepID=UPI000B43F5ED|nr:LysR family transcriptional regulator [Gottfriedia luciferensis]